MAIQDQRFRLIRGDTREGLFDLQGRDDDGPNQLDEPLGPEEQEAYAVLDAALSPQFALFD